MAVDNFIEEHPPWQRLLSSISGGSIEIEALTVTENGTYSEEGKAYSPVTVNVSGGADIPTGLYFVNEDANTRLDKTWNEINTMYDDGSGWIILSPYGLGKGVNPRYVSEIGVENDLYAITTTDITNEGIQVYYVTDNANGYPTKYTPE